MASPRSLLVAALLLASCGGAPPPRAAGPLVNVYVSPLPVHDAGAPPTADPVAAKPEAETKCEGSACGAPSALAQENVRKAAILAPSCQAGNLDSCSNLALLYAEPHEGIAPDKGRAASLLQLACDSGAMRGRRHLGASATAAGE